MRAALMRVLLSLGAVACSDAQGPASVSLSVQTNASQYQTTLLQDGGPHLQYRFSLVGTIENTGDATVYLERCFPDSPEPMVSVKGSAFMAPEVCVGHDQQFQLDPGETRTDTFTFVGRNAWDRETGLPSGDVAGEFRLVYKVSRCRACVAPVPDSVAYSPLFRVLLPE